MTDSRKVAGIFTTKTWSKDHRRDRRDIVHVRLPIIRTYFLVAGAYYAIMAVVHLLGRAEFPIVSALAAITAAIALAAAIRLRRPVTPRAIDAMVVLIDALVVANIQLAMIVTPDAGRLLHFILAIVVFGVTGRSLRHALPGIALALLCLFGTIVTTFPALLVPYAIAAATAVLASLGPTWVLNDALTRALAGRQSAEAHEREAQRLAAIARTQADTDGLTGVANHRSFFDALALGWSDVEPGSYACMIAIDLDGFKPVNDHYGHRAGDHLLKVIALRLRDAMPATARVARVGGDEFTVILVTADRDREPRAICDRIRGVIAKPIMIDGDAVRIGASIGCAVEEVASADGSRLAERADFALYHAKRAAKGQAIVFGDEHADSLRESAAIDQALRGGDLEAELAVVFQPQWDLASGRLIGAEALARWNSRRLGPVPPDRFIPLAERSGLIGSVTRIVLREALRAAAQWPADWTISVNISAHDVLSAPTIADVVAIADASGVPADRIEFEITEGALAADLDRALRHLSILLERGHRIALDDFGGGYSHFDHLSRLPFSKLKIDRSLVQSWGRDGHAGRRVTTMIDMSRILNIDCVLEGLETRDQLDRARMSGATIVQGYVLAPPMTSADLMRRFAAPARRRAG